MKRRNFLKNIGKLSAGPLLLNGVGVKSFASPSMLNFLSTCVDVEDRSIVVLFLKGGNDGLNTIIPVDQYSTYINHRPTVGIPESGTGAYIPLDPTLSVADQVGIHPSMTSFKSMYESGKARVVQAVGYPNINQSHFGSADLWLGGRDGIQGIGSTGDGWIGRFFENAYPGVHGSPSSGFMDPLGIQLGDTKASLAFHDCSSNYEAVNLTGQDPSELFGLISGVGTAPHATPIASEFGEKLDFIMEIENSTNVYGERITNVYNAGTNSNTIYPASDLANQMAMVARLLAGGSQTKVFQLHKGDFDTHASQVESGDPSIGHHAVLLTDLFDSIKAFHDDLSNLGLGQKVVTVVFSEFSRRITENGSLGTDHGNYGPMFLFGDGIKPGISGTNFDLTAINSNGNMNASEMQHDYRSVFKTVLQDWMGAGDNILNPAQFEPYPLIPDLIEGNQVVDPSCYIGMAAPLPVVLVYFDAYLNDDKEVELDWETSSEIELSHFEIFRMQNQREEKVLTIDSKGTSTSVQNYDAIDENPLNGISYYKLRAVNIDGTYDDSDWQAINLKVGDLKHVKIYPNPAKFDFNLVLTTDNNRDAKMEIVDVSGKLILNKKLDIQSGFNKFSVDVSSIPNGNFFVKVSGNGLDETVIPLVVGR